VTVTLELKPEIEAGLVAQAHARGLSLEAYLEQVLQSAVAPNRPEERKSLARLFADSPFKGLNLNFERDTDTGRPVKL
jgi:hypothetical protein